MDTRVSSSRKNVRQNNNKTDGASSTPSVQKAFALSPVAKALRHALSALKQGPRATGKRKAAGQAGKAPRAQVIRQSKTSDVRFEALEPRILLSGDVNPSALSISGAIDAQGEKDQYEFTLEESRRVVFDSLTNRGDISWQLEGPDGQVTDRAFNNTDYSSASPAFELQEGTYKLTVDGTGDAVGGYELRVVDADAAADMALDENYRRQVFPSR